MSRYNLHRKSQNQPPCNPLEVQQVIQKSISRSTVKQTATSDTVMEEDSASKLTLTLDTSSFGLSSTAITSVGKCFSKAFVVSY